MAKTIRRSGRRAFGLLGWGRDNEFSGGDSNAGTERGAGEFAIQDLRPDSSETNIHSCVYGRA